jgi:cytochrome c-type biogenesis protein
MSLLPEVANPYLQALLWGFLYGIVFCTSSCLPYVASYIAGIGGGFRKGLTVTLIFNTGRIVAYAIIGAAIGFFKIIVSDPALSFFQKYSSFAFGIISIVVGASIIWKSEKSHHNCDTKGCTSVDLKKTNRRFDLGAFTLGLSRGLLLCTPLMLLLGYSVPFAAPIDSFILAVLFGLGTALSPLLLIGGATGWLLNQAPLFRKWISRIGGCILILLGLVTLANVIATMGV